MSEAKSFFDVIGDSKTPRAAADRAPVFSVTTSNAGRVILGREVEIVAATAKGGRNDALNKAAFNVGQLVAGGEIDENEAVDALTLAGQTVGLSDREISATLRSGLGSGMDNPRRLRASNGGGTPPAPAPAGGVLPTSLDAPEATPEDEEEARRLAYEAAFRRQVAEEVTRMRVREEARTHITAEHRPAMPEAMSLTNALALPLDPLPWRVDGLMPREGICLFSAPQKAGKTTMMGNLARALVDGDKFLDAFDVPEPCKVTLVDTELGERRMYDWLRDQRIQNPDMLNTVSLRGREAALDPRDPKNRAQWVDIFAGSGVVILDVVGPVVAALGLDESDNSDVGRFWTAWRTLIIEAGVPGALVVHHTGHDERRAIGASSWLRYPDAVWKIEREDEEPTSPRYFSAYGRDVEVYQGAITFSPLDRRLSYTGKSKAKTKASRNAELLADLLRTHGPSNQTACVSLLNNAHGVSRDAGRAVPAQGVRDGLLTTWKDGKSDVYGVAGTHFPAGSS